MNLKHKLNDIRFDIYYDICCTLADKELDICKVDKNSIERRERFNDLYAKHSQVLAAKDISFIDKFRYQMAVHKNLISLKARYMD